MQLETTDKHAWNSQQRKPGIEDEDGDEEEHEEDKGRPHKHAERLASRFGYNFRSLDVL